MDGLLIVDKPAGITSAEVVRVAKRRLRCKTGHLGTLDPFATGVLPLCLGAATKIAQFLNTADKAYTGTICLGVRTDTGDLTGAVIDRAAVPPLDPARLAVAARACAGDVDQTPPMYSAIKVGGTPLYKLARRGVVVAREVRRVHIGSLDLTLGDVPDRIDFAIHCSKGTYVRVVAEQVAEALGTLGHLTALRRTRFGPFGLEAAVSLEVVEAGTARCIGLRDALSGVREIRLDREQSRRARQGFTPLLTTVAPGAPGEVATLVDPLGDLAAVVIMDAAAGWRFARVFTPPEEPS